MDRWRRELAPQVQGWLGSTAGVTADGEFIAVVGFESPKGARSTAQRPGQNQWWAELAKTLEADPTVHGCPVVDVFGDVPENAGVVQVMQARATALPVLKIGFSSTWSPAASTART